MSRKTHGIDMLTLAVVSLLFLEDLCTESDCDYTWAECDGFTVRFDLRTRTVEIVSFEFYDAN